MSSLNIGNGNWAVKEDNLLGFRYDETEGVFLPREMTFSRACDATRVNPDGLIERVPWNLLEYSEQFDNAYWVKYLSSITANATTAPNGTLTADSISDNTTNDAHSIYKIVTSNATSLTWSIYAKKNTLNFLIISAYVGSHNRTWFNLNTGAVGTNATGNTANIENVGNGWYKCSISRAIGVGTLVFEVGVSNSDGVSSYVGNGSGIYIWGAQLNEGSTAKDYFPTTNRQDIARIDYSSGTGALLLEPQRTNIALYSEQFDNAWWQLKTDVTISANTTDTLDPSGLNGADKVSETATLARHRIATNTLTTSASAYAGSLFVKAGTARYAFLHLSGTQSSTIVVDMQTGTVTDTQSSGSVNSYNVETFGNGWYKITIVEDLSSVTTAYQMQFGSAGSAQPATYNNYVPQFTGSTSNYFYIWGAQLEAGSYATSYIKTSGTTVTRVADECSVDPSSLLGATQGSWFMELNDLTFEIPGTSVPTNWLGLDVSNCLAIEARGAGQNKNIYFVKEESNAVTTLTSKVISGTLKACFVWNGTSLKCFVDGVKAYDASGFTQPSSWSTLEFNYSNREAQQLINQTILFPTALTDAEAIALTTL